MPKILNRPTESSLMSNYSRSDLAFVSGKGVWLFDDKGKMFLDLASGIAVNSLGHSHPRLVKVLVDQGSKLWHTSNLYTVPNQEKLAKLLTNNTFAEKVFFTNSGAESVECAMKIARRFFFSIGQSERNRIISFDGAFHGRTMGTISAAGSRKLLEGFGPKLPGFDLIKNFSLESVEKKITRRTCAILVEPILGEGGIVPLTCSFLKGLKNLCEKYNLLLIFDEVQSGVGRTGTLMAYMGYGVIPDISTLAKGLGGGIPIGATLAKNRIAKAFQPGTHGSTFGGNPLACIVAKKVIDIISSQKVLSGVIKKTISFTEKLNSLSEKYDIFSDVRSAGLWIGCDFKKVKSSDFIQAAYNEGLIVVQAAGEKTIRLAPSLIISDKEINEGFKRFEKAYKNII